MNCKMEMKERRKRGKEEKKDENNDSEPCGLAGDEKRDE